MYVETRSVASTRRNHAPPHHDDGLPQATYAREFPAALAQCEGIADWLLPPNIKPGCDEVIVVFRQSSVPPLIHQFLLVDSVLSANSRFPITSLRHSLH